MNNFTKEELLLLLEDALSTRHGCQEYWPIIEKIQSMIDNYCDHKWDGWVGYDSWKKCKHCKEVYK